MRWKILLSLIALLLISSVSAELAYEGWVYNNKFLTFDNVQYRALLSSNNLLILKTDTDSKILELEDCFKEDYKRFCFNVSAYDTNKEDYKAYIYIYYMTPEITITRSVSNNLHSVGETAEFQVTITNEGDSDAEDVEFGEEFPKYVDIHYTKGVEIKNNTAVYWKGDLDIGETKDFSYKIKSTNKIDKNIAAYVEYFDGNQIQKEYSSTVRLYAAPILDFDLDLNKEEYEINEDMEFTLSLENDGDSDVEIEDLDILIPNFIDIEEYDKSFSRINNGLTWDGTLGENDSEEFEFTFSGHKSGVNFIILSGIYKYGGQEYEIKNEKIGYLITNEGVELTTSLASIENVKSNQLLTVFLKVKNKNSFSEIRDVTVRTETDIAYFEEMNYGTVDINETIFLINTELQIPIVENTKTYPVKFNVTYETEDGNKYSSTLERKIKVSPFKQLQIDVSPSSGKVVENKDISISVTVKNEGLDDLEGIYLVAHIPDNFKVKGPTSTYIDLDASSQKSALTFTLTPDLVDEKKEFTLDFSADYALERDTYTITKTSKVNVEPDIPDINLKKSLSVSSSYTGEFMDISYTITNKDDLPVHDLVLKTSTPQIFDIYNVFEKRIDKLYPGEQLTISGEQAIGKKGGIHNLGRAILYFKDEYSRRFNVTSGGISVKLEEADITQPAIFIEHSLTNGTIEPGEKTVLKINLTNLGQTTTSGYLSGFEEGIIVPFYRSEILTKTLSYRKTGTYEVPISVFTYSYSNNEIKAYSNEVKVYVVNDTTKPLPPSMVKDKPVQDVEPEPVVKKKTFFQRLLDFFKSLF